MYVCMYVCMYVYIYIKFGDYQLSLNIITTMISLHHVISLGLNPRSQETLDSCCCGSIGPCPTCPGSAVRLPS